MGDIIIYGEILSMVVSSLIDIDSEQLCVSVLSKVSLSFLWNIPEN